MATLAPSLDQMRDEANAAAPNRDKASDGWIGDADHATRKSDHNPDGKGMVHALDLDHDPAGGWDAHARCDHLRQRAAAGLEPRLTYVISNGRIASAAHGWYWRTYTGASPHTAHAHHSIGYRADQENDRTPWFTDQGALTVADVNTIIKAIELHALAAYLDRRKESAAQAKHTTTVVKSAIAKLGGKIDDLAGVLADDAESDAERDARIEAEVRAEFAALQAALDELPQEATD